jgi:cobalt-zinc-cadmium efflux system outer membrane protein
VGTPLGARAQGARRVTLEQAIAAALASPRLTLARADSAAARAQVRVARAFPNPALLYDYTTDPPHNHLIPEQPLEYPWVRAARIRAASTGASAADYLLAAERAAIRHDVEVSYTQAAAAHEIAGLSRRNVAGTDELVRVATARRRAGDAAELDVLLAGVTAQQARNTYLTDSLTEITSLLDLQALMGLPAERLEIALADSLDMLPAPAPGPAVGLGEAGFPAVPSRLAAARAEVASQQATLTEARRNRLPAPAIRAGAEWGAPDEKGLLPVVGISLPIPLWNRSGGDVAVARAAVTRAQASLALAELQTRNAIARFDRERALARDKVARDRVMVRDAERVAEMSLTAYHEGAYTLASVLEAQRSARDALRQFLQDLAEARTAEAEYVLARTAGAEASGASSAAPTPPARAPAGGIIP